MGQLIIKPSRDEDFYVVWSTVVEGPLDWGTREDILENLEEGGEERLARTDRNGTSALWPDKGPYAYGFEDGGMIYEQRGWLPRANLKALCERLENRQDALGHAEFFEPQVDDLLEPFDDDPDEEEG